MRTGEKKKSKFGAVKVKSEFVGLCTEWVMQARKWNGATVLPPRSEINIQQ